MRLRVIGVARRASISACLLRRRVGLAAGAAVAVSPGVAQAASACQVGYTVSSDWGTGFTACGHRSRTPGRRSPAGPWATPTPATRPCPRAGAAPGPSPARPSRVTNASWNGSLATGASTQIGANFTYSGTNTAPTAFTLNGAACNGASGSPSPTPTPTTTPTSSPTPTPTPSPTSTGSAARAAAARVREQAGQRQRQPGRAARRGPVGHRVRVRAGQRDLRRPERPGVHHRHEELGRQRGPGPAERGVLERRVLRQRRLRGRELHQRHQGLRQPAERERHGGHPGPALDRRAYTGNSAGCSSAQATCQKPMPDAAQAIPFWTSVASTFKGNDAVIFDLFNEPYASRADRQHHQRLAVLADRRHLRGHLLPGGGHAAHGQRGPLHRGEQRDHAGRRGVLQRPDPVAGLRARPTPTTTWSRPGTRTTSTPAPASPAGPARSPR